MTTDVSHNRSLSNGVAEEIRVQLARRRMSGRELARRLAVSPNWVSLRTSGAQPIDLNDLERIAAVFEIDAIDLLPRKPERISRSSFVPLGERVLATIGEGRPPRRVQRRHRPGRAVPRTRPVTPLPA